MVFGLIIITAIMAVDKLISMYLPRWGWVHRLRWKDAHLKAVAQQYPGYFAVAAWVTNHKVGRDYTQAARMHGPAYRGDNAGDGPVSFSQSFLNDDCWRRIMHWELMMAVQAREERLLQEAEAAVPRIQALWRGWKVRHEIDMDIYAWGGLEDRVHSELSNDQVAALAHWHPFAWDWFVRERAAWAEEEEGWREDGGHDAWGEQVDPLDVSHHGSMDWDYSDEENMPPPLSPASLTLGDFMFGPEFSSDNAGDGPSSWDLEFDPQDIDRVQPRVQDTLVEPVPFKRRVPFRWEPNDPPYKGDYDKWFNDLKRFQAGEKQLGKHYRSNNAGDGPPSARVPESPLPEVDDIVINEDDMEILLFRFEILTEMMDLQIWTYGMRIHEHEYQGEPFDHHEHMGTTEIFSRISRFNNALHHHFRSGGGDCWVDRDSWMAILNDLETIERADMFHDVHCQEHLQSLVTDFILFSCLDDHHFEPRPSDTCFQIPLF